VTDASGAQTIFDYATNQYVAARFTNYVTGKVTNTIPRANVIIPEGDAATYTSRDGTKTPIPGMEGLNYFQFAAQGRALQKTQFGPNPRPAAPGPHDVSYTLYGSKLPCRESVQSTSVLSSDSEPLGSPSLQARASQSSEMSGALAPGACPPSILEPSLFTGIDTSLPGIADLAPEASDKLRPLLEKIDAQIAEAQRLFSPTHPELTAPPLRIALATVDQFLNELTNPNINDLPADETYDLLHELRIKRTQLNNALVLANNISVEAFLGQQSKDEVQSEKLLLTSDKHASITVNISNHGTEEIRAYVKKIEAFPQDCSTDIITLDGEAQRPGTSETSHFDFDCKHGFNATRPYFSRSGIEQPYYDVAISDLRNAPTTPSPLRVVVSFEDHEVPLTAEALVQYPAGPMKNQPSIVVPPVSVIVSSRTGLLTPKFACALLDVIVKGNIRQTTGTLSVDRLQGWDTGEPVNFNIANAGEEHREELLANPGCGPDPLEALPKNLPPGSTFSLKAVARVAGQQYREGYRAVGYPGLTSTNYYEPSTYQVTAVDVHTAPNLNIAYIQGTGDTLPTYLKDLLIETHILTTADLTPESLKPYDAIILGVRANEAHPELAAANPALNTYATNGGIVIAQYNTTHLPEDTGPYPLSLGPEKVVEEDAPVQILAPTDPLLTWPNHITTADFDHWIEERGHGFMATWDPHYTALVETHDHGQAPQRGGLLVARTGRGAWIYLGLALYRQLPEGVPGAYRILANLISAAKNPALQK
ncbi:MAG TPA: hypothetical protein VGU23_04465, partial [Acidobacteriaceae bacterium]|nr:hypothetical protein [Acidobacteriaceae bacterium]